MVENYCIIQNNKQLFGVIFDREQRSKVLKKALLLFLAWKHEQKMFQMEQQCSYEILDKLKLIKALCRQRITFCNKLWY